MANTRLGTESGVLRGYVEGQEIAMILDTPEQISAFIMKNRMDDVIITDIFDQMLIETSMGFLMQCSNQEYLAKHLLPVLVPMQNGEVEIVEFLPVETNVEKN